MARSLRSQHKDRGNLGGATRNRAGSTVRFLHCGDTALTVEFGDIINRSTSARVLEFRRRVQEAAMLGVLETIPTYRSLMVQYDPTVTGWRKLIKRIEPLLNVPFGGEDRGRTWHIPVCYAPNHAPDLSEVADRTGLTPEEVVALHSSVRYHVYMIGFLPGFPYLGDLPVELSLPRRDNPRVKVPAGSVAIATTMTAIYSVESPGGWHLIGSTPVPIFDPTHSPPALLAPGDGVRFESVSPAEWDSIRKSCKAGAYQVPCEPRTE